MNIVCPACKVDNPGYRLHCWQCGESLVGVERTENSRGTSSLTTMSTDLTATHTTNHYQANVKKIAVCPKCLQEQPGTRLICSQCGQDLTAVKRIDKIVASSAELPLSDKPDPPAAIQIAAQDYIFPEEPASGLQVAFSVGLFLLIILLASVLFQVLHPTPRILFIAGIVTGFGMIYLITSPNPDEPNKGGHFPKSSIPEWLTLPIVLLFGIILLAFTFGWDFIFDWLFSQDPAERILALVFGAVFGVVIELSLNHLLDTIRRYRLV